MSSPRFSTASIKRFQTQTIKEQKCSQNGKLVSSLPKSRDFHVATVFKILHEAIEKLKISLLLPHILENPKTLHKYVKGSEYEDCLKVIKEYREQWILESLEVPSKLNYPLLKVIDYFHANYKILDILPNWLDDIEQEEKRLLDSCSLLTEITRKHFDKIPLEELAQEKYLHELYWTNERIKEEIEDIMLQIQNRKFVDNWKTATKTGIIKSLEDELTQYQADIKIGVNEGMTKSNRDIQKLKATFEAKEKALNEELEKSRFNYEQVLQKNLKQEKSARDEKNKYQLQMQAIIRKYDQTMLEKYKEETQLNEDYEELQKEFENFLLEYNREYAVYDQQVIQKQKADKEQSEIVARLFRENLAARRIQRWWKQNTIEECKETKTMGKIHSTKAKKPSGTYVGRNKRSKVKIENKQIILK